MKRSFVFLAVALTAALSQAAAIGWGIACHGEETQGQYAGQLFQVFIRHSDKDGNVLSGTGTAEHPTFAPAGDVAAAEKFLTDILDAEGAKGSDLAPYVFGDGILLPQGNYNQPCSDEGHGDIHYTGTGVQGDSQWLHAWFILFDTDDATTATQYAIFGPQPMEMGNDVTSQQIGIGRVHKVGEPMPWRPIGGTPVPEPVAAALLALGVAAFGLKRKACK